MHQIPSPDELQMMVFNTWQDRSEVHNNKGDPTIDAPYHDLQQGHSNPFYTQIGTTTTHVQYMPMPHLIKVTTHIL